MNQNQDVINMTTFSVLTAAGDIDQALTTEKFRNYVMNWSESKSNDLAKVRKAVSDLFDANQGQTLSGDLIVAAVSAELRATSSPVLFRQVKGQIEEILSAAPYVRKTGQNGGVSRVQVASESTQTVSTTQTSSDTETALETENTALDTPKSKAKNKAPKAKGKKN